MTYVSSHPAFNNRSLANDFAVLHLSQEFVLSPHVDVACLPTGDYSNYDKANCVAMGWGKDEFGDKGQYQVILRQVPLDLVSNYDCQERLRDSRLGEFFELDDSFVCALGRNSEDTCRGDGGGPLMCRTQGGSYVQVCAIGYTLCTL